MATTSTGKCKKDYNEDNNTEKHRQFVSSPMRNRTVLDVPGIGPKGAECLKMQKFTDKDWAYILLGCYIAFEKNEKKFKDHLKCLGVQESDRDTIFNTVKHWNDRTTKDEKDKDVSDELVIPSEAAAAVKRSLESKKKFPAYVLLGRYLALDKDAYSFKQWLNTFAVRKSYPRRTVSALKEWCLLNTVVPPASCEKLTQYMQACLLLVRYISVEKNIELFRKYLHNLGYKKSHQDNIIHAMRDFCSEKHKLFEELPMEMMNVRHIPGIDDATIMKLIADLKRKDLQAYVLMGCYIAFKEDDEKVKNELSILGVQSDKLDSVVSDLKAWDFVNEPTKYTVAGEIGGIGQDTINKIMEKITKITIPAHALLGCYKERKDFRQYLQNLHVESHIVDAVTKALEEWNPETEPVKFRFVTDIPGIDNDTAELLMKKILDFQKYFELGCSTAFQKDNEKFRQYLQSLGVKSDFLVAFFSQDLMTEPMEHTGASKARDKGTMMGKLWDEIPKTALPAYVLLGRCIVFGSFKQWLTKLNPQISSAVEIVNSLKGWYEHYLTLKCTASDKPVKVEPMTVS